MGETWKRTERCSLYFSECPRENRVEEAQAHKIVIMIMKLTSVIICGKKLVLSDTEILGFHKDNTYQ